MKPIDLIDKLIETDNKTPTKMLFVGDYMADVYVHGRYAGQSQEGCTRFVEEDKVTVPGGVGNAVRSLSNWRTMTYAVFDSRVYPVKTRFLTNDVCVFRHDNDQSIVDHKVIRDNVLDILSRWKPSAVLLSDYDKGTLTLDLIKEVVGICNQTKIPCVADVKRPPEVYTGCILKMNNLYRDKYISRLPFKDMIVTCGSANPMVWVESTVWGLGYGSPSVKCVNHVGAGDCFAAHLTLALAHGLGLRDATVVAHAAGRCYVQQRNNAPPTFDGIRQDMMTWSDTMK